MSTSFDKKGKLGTVEGKVKYIVETMGADVEYLFMNWAQANVQIDRIKRPTVLYLLPPSGYLNVAWNQIKDRPETFIAFLCSTEFDFDGEENDNLIEQMKRLAMRFIKRFNESGLFEIIENDLPYQVLYDYLDQNVTGIVIHPVLKEIEGVSICDEIERLDLSELEDE